MATKVAVIYYSATGTTYRLAQAVEEGASEAGADVRLRKVRDSLLTKQSPRIKDGQLIGSKRNTSRKLLSRTCPGRTRSSSERRRDMACLRHS
jgi:hypothetical protein